MEEFLLSELMQSLAGNETPSGVILCGVAIYIMTMIKKQRRDIKQIATDLDIIKRHLGITNVIELPNNTKSKK